MPKYKEQTALNFKDIIHKSKFYCAKYVEM